MNLDHIPSFSDKCKLATAESLQRKRINHYGTLYQKLEAVLTEHVCPPRVKHKVLLLLLEEHMNQVLTSTESVVAYKKAMGIIE